MRLINKSTMLVLALVVALIVAGCASSKVTSTQSQTGDQRLPKPNRILVYDFAASADVIAKNAALTGNYAPRETEQTPEEIELGRKLGTLVASELVEEIRQMGLPAEVASQGTASQVGDLVIRGAFVEIDKGSRTKRMLIGFGAGAGELKTNVVAYAITPTGPRQLGEANIEDTGGKMPGMLVPVGAGAAGGEAARAAVVGGGIATGKELGPENMQAAAKRTAKEIAEILKKGFIKQGWIS